MATLGGEVGVIGVPTDSTEGDSVPTVDGVRQDSSTRSEGPLCLWI